MTPDQPKVAAIVPMRHHSERVPGKNYRDFAGQPLYHCIVKTLLACPSIDEVMIDTDSPFILEDATHHFPTVKRLTRPEALRDGSISMNRVLQNSLKSTSADVILQTHTTNPLLSPQMIERALSTFLKSSDNDALFSVTPLYARFYNQSGQPINHDPSQLLRTQDLPPIYLENSNLYIFYLETFTKTGNRLGTNPMMFPIPTEEAIDIDEEIDFKMAEYLFRHHHPVGAP